LPADLLALPRLGAINIHAAPLPRWRGPSPLESMILAGDTEAGMTVHRMAADLDTGAILAQERIPFDETDDLDAIMAKLGDIFPGLVIQALERVARGEPGEPQDESLATYAPLPDETWEPIDWGRPAQEIHRQVRALTFMRPHPGGRATIDGAPVRIAKTRLMPSEPSSGEPGSVLRRDGDTLVVQCGDGPLAILAWSPEPTT
jgi:methionyl-tRNA formyltransferase